MDTYIMPPGKCQLCHRIIVNEFYDAKTVMGPWANMCSACFKINGVGLGVGKGQHYKKDANGDFIKQ